MANLNPPTLPPGITPKEVQRAVAELKKEGKVPNAAQQAIAEAAAAGNRAAIVGAVRSAYLKPESASIGESLQRISDAKDLGAKVSVFRDREAGS